MNKNLLVFVLIAALVITFTARTQTKQDVPNFTTDGRYTIVCTSAGSNPTAAYAFVLDKQSGRVWQMSVGGQRSFRPCRYLPMDGGSSSSWTPISTEKDQQPSAPTNIPIEK